MRRVGRASFCFPWVFHNELTIRVGTDLFPPRELASLRIPSTVVGYVFRSFGFVRAFWQVGTKQHDMFISDLEVVLPSKKAWVPASS